jgi:hypothetical protein
MSNYLRMTCLFTLGAIGLAAQTVSAPVPVTQTTGMIGLAQGQTAQMNLLNPGPAPSATTGVICTATVTFFDASGTALKTVPLTVLPGKSQSASISSDADLSIVAGQRRDIRAQVAIPGLVPSGTASSAPSICKLIPTLEIYDSMSGRTLVSLGHLVDVVTAVPTASSAGK